jgi:hypothetical protein
MSHIHGVEVGMRRAPAPLEVAAAHETGVDVLVGQRDGTELLKVKVEQWPVDLERGRQG